MRSVATVALSSDGAIPKELERGRTYYPGTLSVSEAQLVSVRLGQEVADVTFPLVPARIAMLSGVVLSSEGKPLPRAIVSLGQTFGRDGIVSGYVSSGGNQTNPEGLFTIRGVVPGEYTLYARSPNATSVPAESESASVHLIVTGDDITGISVVTTKGATARGQITFEAERAPVGIDPDSLRLFGVATDLRMMPGLRDKASCVLSGRLRFPV